MAITLVCNNMLVGIEPISNNLSINNQSKLRTNASVVTLAKRGKRHASKSRVILTNV